MRALCLAALLAACGGTRSGLPGEALLVALDPADIMTECQYLFDAYPPRFIACDINNQFTIDNGTVEGCVSDHDAFAMKNPDCAVTVAEYEACQADLDAEPDAFYCTPTPTPPMSCVPLHTAACSN